MSAFLDERYSDWLYSQVCSVEAKTPSRTYKNLFHILYTKEFVWLVPNDDNRLEDGKDLRYEFLEGEGIDPDHRDQYWMQLGCSMLELFVAIARRLSFEAEGDPSGWFHELLENLDLSQYTDRADIDKDHILEVLDRVIWRTYDSDGSGGLFPLQDPHEDQTKVELWYQLSSYILEQE